MRRNDPPMGSFAIRLIKAMCVLMHVMFWLAASAIASAFMDFWLAFTIIGILVVSWMMYLLRQMGPMLKRMEVGKFNIDDLERQHSKQRTLKLLQRQERADQEKIY